MTPPMAPQLNSRIDEEQRLAALARYDILGTPPEDTFDLVTTMVADMLQAPQACVSLVDRDRVWFKSRVGVEVCEVPREPGFCSSLIQTDDEVLHIEDASQNRATRDNSLTEGDQGIRFYAGAPLCTPEGARIGTLCTFGPEPRGLHDAERRFLQKAAHLVMHEIELRRTRKQLERTEAALRASQRFESIGMVAGGVAHDFNNLLGGILGNASLARATLDDNAREQAMLAEIESTVQRAATLVNQVFAFAGQGEESPPKPVDLNALIHETWSSLAPSSPQDVRVELTLAERLPPVHGQSIGLRQLMMNLLTNAVEACEAHAGKLVRVRTEAEEGSVRITVTDDGPGLTPDSRARIFEPFFSSKSGGRGLGLAIVKRIVEQHEGTIAVTSQPGNGTTFRITLPICAAPNEWCGLEVPADVVPDASTVVPATAATVLVVDDQDFIRNLARRSLERAGYQVRLASGGAEAIEILEAPECMIDVVVLDWSMPIVDGAAVLRALRKRHTTLPVIVSSGHPEVPACEPATGHAVRWFVRKPYRPDALVSTVAEALEADTPMMASETSLS